MDEESLFRDIHRHLLQQAQDGSRIDTENQLAERFQVTRYKVRKALDILSQMGVLERAPKRGMTVNQVGPESLSVQIQYQMDIGNFDIREFIEARLLIEADIIPLAMRRMTPALVGRLETAIAQIEANAASPSDADHWDREFHLLLLEACGNRVLQVFSAALVIYFEKTAAHIEHAAPEVFLEIAAAERAILSAMKAGDEERAKELLREHLRDQIAMLTD